LGPIRSGRVALAGSRFNGVFAAMSRSLVETLMGAVVLAVAIAFIVFAYTRSSVATVEGYEVTAKFTRVDGLLRGADVRVGGIKVGSVIDQLIGEFVFSGTE
jgi:phospholipid/cholesterol/gamma-HCH transport system substrate-binding protein